MESLAHQKISNRYKQSERKQRSKSMLELINKPASYSPSVLYLEKGSLENFIPLCMDFILMVTRIHMRKHKLSVSCGTLPGSVGDGKHSWIC